MRSSRPLWLFGTFGALSVVSGSVMADVDTSQWKCESCPFEKGTTGTVDLGVGGVSQDSAKFGDYTGLNQKGAFVIAGGTVRHRDEDGYWGDLDATNLGLDVRALAARGGREGQYALRLGYAEIPRYLTDTAVTPFLGVGGSSLSLPAGFPQVNTAAMPLSTTLHPADLTYKRSRLDLGGTWLAGDEWSYRVNFQHDVRDGTQRSSGSFFSTASQLVAPVDQTTDQVEVSASYASTRLQATVAYQGSLFRNGTDSLTWANPFTPVVNGANFGQLALAPDNQFHQIYASAGYDIAPGTRASGNIAFGRMTQDAAYLAATLNPNLPVPALPAQSLQGLVDTFNLDLKLTATPMDRLRLNATYARNVRDNKTPVESYPSVSTDLFVGATPRTNQPFSFTDDRIKLDGDYVGPGSLRTSAGLDYDARERTLQEVVTTRETTLWGRMAANAAENVSWALKLAHSLRTGTTYGVATWITPPENPLLRKFYMADRTRNMADLRTDIAVGAGVNIGLGVNAVHDMFKETTLGLLDVRSFGYVVDVSAAVDDKTQVHVFAQGDRAQSQQSGSQSFSQPDWWGNTDDTFNVVGLGVKQAMLGGKLEVGADLLFSRSRSDWVVDAITSSPAFPTAKTSMDSFRLKATYRLKENISLIGSYWYEHYDAQNWRLDGVTPSTVSNLLAFGEQPPHYNVNVLQLAVRYRF